MKLPIPKKTEAVLLFSDKYPNGICLSNRRWFEVIKQMDSIERATVYAVIVDLDMVHMVNAALKDIPSQIEFEAHLKIKQSA